MYHANVLMKADTEIIVHTTILPQRSTPRFSSGLTPPPTPSATYIFHVEKLLSEQI